MAQISGGAALNDALRKMTRKLKTASVVRVGFLEGATYPDGTSVATVAALQNFGAPGAGVPAHPFFTTMIAEKSPDWGRRFLNTLERAGYNAEAALNLFGEGMVSQLRRSIIDMNSPALSPVTVLLRDRFRDHDEITFADVQQARRDVAAGKGVVANGALAKPLVWTGHMLASVDKEVE